MIETLANGYSSDSAQQELSNEYQHDRTKMVFHNFLHFCAFDESSLRVKTYTVGLYKWYGINENILIKTNILRSI